MDTKKSAKEVAYEYIKERIINGEYAPNDKIDDVAIASKLEISKMPIREAIQILVSQNFLKTAPKIGTIVKEITIEDMYQIYEPLANIQGLAARIACISIKDKDIIELVNINNKLKNAFLSDDFTKAMRYDKEFHNYILRVADNPYIINFCEELYTHVQRIEYKYLTTITSFSKTPEQHSKIIEAFKNKDEELAQKLMEDNWLTTIPDLNIRSLSKLVNTLK